MSHASAMSRPPPAATPLTAASTGFSHSRNATTIRCVPRSHFRRSSGVGGDPRPEPSWLTSPPAQNASPSPVTTTARTSGSRWALRSASIVSAWSAVVMALRFSGTENVRVATPASTE